MEVKVDQVIKVKMVMVRVKFLFFKFILKYCVITVYCHLDNNEIEGEDPPIPDRSIDAPRIWEEAGFKYRLRELHSSDLVPSSDGSKRVYTKYTVWAKMNNSNSNPSSGGDGGAGGIGGYAGIVHAIGLEQIPNFSIFNKQGNEYVSISNNLKVKNFHS